MIHPAYPLIGFPEIRAELLRELAYRREAYPRLIAKGAIGQAEAQHQIDLIAAIGADMDRFAAWQGRARQPGEALGPPPAAGHAFTWAQRRAALTREIDLRRQHYPQWIAKGRLNPPEARQQLDRLEAARALYELGWDYPLTPDAERGPGGVLIDWQTIETEIATREGKAQEQLAL